MFSSNSEKQVCKFTESVIKIPCNFSVCNNFSNLFSLKFFAVKFSKKFFLILLDPEPIKGYLYLFLKKTSINLSKARFRPGKSVAWLEYVTFFLLHKQAFHSKKLTLNEMFVYVFAIKKFAHARVCKFFLQARCTWASQIKTPNTDAQ